MLLYRHSLNNLFFYPAMQNICLRNAKVNRLEYTCPSQTLTVRVCNRRYQAHINVNMFINRAFSTTVGRVRYIARTSKVRQITFKFIPVVARLKIDYSQYYILIYASAIPHYTKVTCRSMSYTS